MAKVEITDKITIYHADCMEIMKSYPDGHFDLAVVDPDYGLNGKISKGGTWAAKYKGFDGSLGGKPDKDYFSELFRVSKNQIVWGGNYFIDMLYPTRCYLVWDKKNGMKTLADCEMAWTSFDKNARIFAHGRNSGKRIHITQKPVALYKWIYDNYASQSFKILDTHLGSGSSAIAAHFSNLEFIGIEINEEFFNSAVERITSFVNNN